MQWTRWQKRPQPQLPPPERADGSRHTIVLGREFCFVGAGTYFANLPAGPLSEQAIDACAAYVAEDATCLDIGANIGVMTLALASIARRGQVIAIEPEPRICDFLRQNVVRNGMTNVDVKQHLVGVAGARKAFLAHADEPGWSTSVDPMRVATIGSGYSEQGIMQCVSVDQLADGLPRLDFIKIDCEGGELAILEGAAATLERFRPTVMLEFNAHCLMNFARINPPDALDRIMAMFPFVARVGRGGALEPLDDRFQFMHDHIVYRHAVDDLMCSFQPLRARVATAQGGVSPSGPREKPS